MNVDEVDSIAFGIVDDYLLTGPEFIDVVEEVGLFSEDDDDQEEASSQVWDKVHSMLKEIRNGWVNQHE